MDFGKEYFADMQPRVRPLPESSLIGELGEMLNRVPTVDGKPLQIYLTLANHPRLLKRMIEMGAVFQKGLVQAKEREFVILWVAARCSSPYIFNDHLSLARKEGVTQVEIEQIWTQSISENWLEFHGALALFADALIRNSRVEDEVWNSVKQHVDEAWIIELISLIGFYKMLCDITNSLRVRLNDFN